LILTEERETSEELVILSWSTEIFELGQPPDLPFREVGYFLFPGTLVLQFVQISIFAFQKALVEQQKP